MRAVRPWAVAVSLVLAAPAVGDTQTTDVRRMRWDGRDRTYTVRIPARFDHTRRAAVVVLLHGLGGSGARFLERSGFAAIADTGGLILVAPDGTGDPRGWYVGFASSGGAIDDVGFVGAVIDSIVRRDGGDPRRIYVAGYSNGGVLAHHVASDLASRIAAAAVVAGTIGVRLERGEVRRIGPPRTPVPVVIVHGDADDVVRYDTLGMPSNAGRPLPAAGGARFWARANECRSIEPRRDTIADTHVVREVWDAGCRASVVFLTLRGGDHAWPTRARGAAIDASELIWEFFRRQPRR